MAESASKGHFTRAADFVHAVADCTSANLNLTTISQKPKHAAQRVRFFNTDGLAHLTVTVTPELGAGQTPFNIALSVGPHRDYTTEFPVAAIVSATSDAGHIEALVMWWTGSSLNINK